MFCARGAGTTDRKPANGHPPLLGRGPFALKTRTKGKTANLAIGRFADLRKGSIWDGIQAYTKPH
ncbi:hypothetical protein TMES_17270 [Thalassospira mesophila]|uniref:Uncharacterized protein n=1 Tax=Thalassospira mesophila TaxID=1293891 RepID=A0A1Y2KZ37_9PROT|nr:hypothetical protein TMES_17270 [Thalassospira mesophila]